MGRITPDLKAGAGRHLLALFPIPTDKLKLSVPFALQAAAFSLPESGPGLVLIGVSSDSNLVKIWTGRQIREMSIQDLFKSNSRTN